jgi:hypothetical protein
MVREKQDARREKRERGLVESAAVEGIRTWNPFRSGGTATVTFAFWKMFTYCYGVLLLSPPRL